MTHLWSDIFSILFAIASVFLIFIVLLQRGRGGGLAGAFGATGGQSAFGTKAGDVFTRITIGVAVVWVALAGITGYAMSRESQNRFQSQATTEPEMFPANPGQTAAGKTGGVGEFEKGNQPGNAGTAGTATGGTATGTAQPAPSKSPSTATTPATKPPATTPPEKSSPAPNATKPSAPAK
jgi:preprotein translocase subunit SecG